MLRFREAEDSEEVPIWESSSSHQVKKMRLGRVFSILFAAEPRELERALVQDGSRSQQRSIGNAAGDLIHHLKEIRSSGLSLEQTCIPILQHAVKSKEPSYRKKSVTLLRWLLQNSDVGMTVGSTLKTIIGASHWDNRVKLGWCVLVRELLQGWSGQLDEESPFYSKKYEIFVGCTSQLISIMLLASIKEDKKKVPTRLAIAAADCFLTITKTLAAGPPAQAEAPAEQDSGVNQQKRSLITPIDSTADDGMISGELDVDLDNIGNFPSTSASGLFSNSERKELALWEQLDNLISLVRELEEWNERSRALFAKGLQYVHRWLLLLANYRDSLQSAQGGKGDVSVGAAVLAACWRHYSGLLLTEDKKLSSQPQPIVQNWLGALQFYVHQTENSDTEEESRRALEMREYALACLALILGRLDTRRLDLVLGEFEPDLLKAMFGQLRGADKNIVELSVAILRAILFRPQSSPLEDTAVTSSGTRMESVVPMLLDMLDTRDVAARAVVLLIAEYFAVNPEAIEMEQLFARLDSADTEQRRNVLDVLSELLSICTRSVDVINSSLSQAMAKHLFKRLGDIELTNRVEASTLFAKLDSSFTLPTLLDLLYSPDGRVRSAASNGLLSVLKGQPDQSKVVVELLDFTTKMVKAALPVPNASKDRRSGRPVDVDRVMRLIPYWADTVENWEEIIRLVLSRMFEEPANAVIPRFLSYISSQLADHSHILFPLILDEMRNQPELTEVLLSELSQTDSEDDRGALGRQLFQRLSPLLVLRVLPLKAFNDLTCKELYGGVSAYNAGAGPEMGLGECITGLLLIRACGAFEFEDVRKVASELIGRLLPNIMIPLVTAQLEDAIHTKDLLIVKACIYALCTSLGIRGCESVNHPLIGHICQLLTSILLWPWSQHDEEYLEVVKAQHGCIDCLAMMICAELQPRPAVSSLDQLAAEPTSRSTLTEKAAISNRVERDSLARETKIKLVEELPDSEQLQVNQFVIRQENRLSEEVLGEEEVKSGSFSGRRKSKLIEELIDSEVEKAKDVRGEARNGVQSTILSRVVDCLTGHQQKLPWLTCSNTQVPSLSVVKRENCVGKGQTPSLQEVVGHGTAIVPLPFRVCMANVLISTCQKVALGARDLLARKMIPPLITFIQVSNDSKLRGASLQVLFTAVYHLKASAVVPYAVDLLGLSIAAIKSQGLLEGPTSAKKAFHQYLAVYHFLLQRERVGGAKLLASLLASEEALVRDLVPYLMDAKSTLSSISAIDTSPELRALCEKLLSCLSSPGEIGHVL